MDGRFVPRGLLVLEPAWRNFLENSATIQFNHRVGSYALAAAILLYTIAAPAGATRYRALLALGLVIAQIGVGVATLVHAVPIGLALVHQGLALILLLVLVWNASAPSRRA
jgi:cytochrome c oxidase assembly protein subunit 15